MRRLCRTSGCEGRPNGRHYVYCTVCRRKRQKRDFITTCQNCGVRFTLRSHDRGSINERPHKFCPVCIERFGGRVKALRMQVEQKVDITQVIIRAGREAFDWSSNADGRDVLARFEGNLGITFHTLHSWLQFFFGMTWPDWKRKYICSGHSCSIVDVSAVKHGGRPKYYVADKFRLKGICACPVRKDDIILVDRPPRELTFEALKSRFPKSARWTKKIRLIEGLHLDYLDGAD